MRRASVTRHSTSGRGRKAGAVIPYQVAPAVSLAALSPAAVAREFKAALAAGVRLRADGTARGAPEALLRGGYTPRYKFVLFDTVYYLTNVRQNPSLRFLVAWVMPAAGARVLHARIFYKDVSLVWRSASHFVPAENWIGKGDVAVVTRNGYKYIDSIEETTDLPLEIQDALETINAAAHPARGDNVAVERILRSGPVDRIQPYDDFRAPRRRALAEPRNRVNGGRSVATFGRADDPESLRIAPGYEPDFARGVIEHSHSSSSMYGGELMRYRILSVNRRIQYLFIAAARHVWIIPPQTLGTEIMSYGVRTVTVPINDRLCVPGFEFHYLDDTVEPPEFVSQIPLGFAGAPNALDPSRADASAWLDRLPVIRAFRREVLGVRGQ